MTRLTQGCVLLLTRPREGSRNREDDASLVVIDVGRHFHRTICIRASELQAEVAESWSVTIPLSQLDQWRDAGATEVADAVDRPGRRIAQHRGAIDAARKAGVKHVIYTSMLMPDKSLVLFAPDHLGTEQALEASGLGWTILCNSWYMENLFMNLPGLFATGKWFTSTGDGKVAHVSREDCARAAAAALASDNAANVRYDITGPQKNTTAQLAAAISEHSGKPIEVVQVTDEQLAEGLKAAGVPAPVVPLLVSFDANTRVGGLDVLSNDVEKLTDIAPQSLRDFLLANKAALKGS